MLEHRITAPVVTAAPTVVAAGLGVNAEALAEESGGLMIKNLSLYYGPHQVLQEVTFPIRHNRVTALIGPSGCGKSSLLRCLNRMNDHLPRCKVTGGVEFDGLNIYAPGVNPTRLRRFVGMVAQKSNPFPKSIYENVAFGIKLHKLARNREEMDAMVCEALSRVGLWNEIKDRLNQNAFALSGGQQQRLCVARTIAVPVRASTVASTKFTTPACGCFCPSGNVSSTETSGLAPLSSRHRIRSRSVTGNST